MTMACGGIAKLLEELGELSTELGKKLAYYHTDEHPDGKGPLSERIEKEMGDVIAAIRFVQLKQGLSGERITDRAEQKLKLYGIWDEVRENDLLSEAGRLRHDLAKRTTQLMGIRLPKKGAK